MRAVISWVHGTLVEATNLLVALKVDNYDLEVANFVAEQSCSKDFVDILVRVLK